MAGGAKDRDGTGDFAKTGAFAETGDFPDPAATGAPDATGPVPPPPGAAGGGGSLQQTGSGFDSPSAGSSVAPPNFLVVEPDEVQALSDTFAHRVLGRSVAGCLLETLLGRGAMGLVFRARHLALEKPVAVKILNPALFYLRRHVDQFFREARAAASLEHPNVVTVHSVGQEQGLYFIVMQLVDGDSVQEWIERQGRLTVGQVVRVGIETASALGEAHRHGIIHRDIKPANLMIAPGSHVKVADFGLAGRCVAGEDAKGRTEVMGTPYYLPPEQIAGGAVDHRADLYSLGVTLYYAATGVRPFEGTNARDIFVKHLTATPRPMTEIEPTIPSELDAVVHRLLLKKPESRPADAEELIRELRAVPTGEAGT